MLMQYFILITKYLNVLMHFIWVGSILKQ